MKKRNEGSLVKACIDLMTARGWTVWRQNQGAMQIKNRFIRFSGMKGISDIIGFTSGSLGCPARFVACECKMPKKKATEEQQAFLDSVSAAGGFAALVYSVDDLEELMNGG